MDLLIAFLIFIGAMVGSLTLGLPSALAFSARAMVSSTTGGWVSRFSSVSRSG